MEMEGGCTVRERGGAEIGCTVETGMVVADRSKVTLLEAMLVVVVAAVV